MALPPYTEHQIHRTTQAEDGDYNDQHGDGSIARVTMTNPNDVTAGIHAELTTAVDPAATPGPVERRMAPNRWRE